MNEKDGICNSYHIVYIGFVSLITYLLFRLTDSKVIIREVAVWSRFKPQVRHQNENMKIFLRRLPLSRFLA